MNIIRDLFSLSPIVVLSTALCLRADAAVIFQADFDNATNGLVSIGGTGSLGTSSNFTATVETASPWLQGGYMRVTNPQTASGGVSGAVTFTPSGTASSWAALHTGGSTSVLNGGVDFFVRAASIINTPPDSASPNSWFRPLDFGAVTGGGLRLILESQSTGELRLQILSPSNGLIRENNTTTGTLTAAGAFSLAQGDTAHIGLTFSTNLEGWITMSLFAAKSTEAIDTSSAAHLIGSVTFKINSSIVTSGLPGAAFKLNGGYIANNQSILDFDTFRLYDAMPASFAGVSSIPEPGTAAAVIGGAAALIAWALRRRR